MALDAALKDVGYLEESWVPGGETVYSDGYGVIVFRHISNRPQSLGENYRIFFSMDDGHIIAIRHFLNGWAWDDGTKRATVHFIV